MLLKHVGHKDPTCLFFLVNPDILKSFFMIESLNLVVLLHLTPSVLVQRPPGRIQEETTPDRKSAEVSSKKEVGGHVYTRVKAATFFYC